VRLDLGHDDLVDVVDLLPVDGDPRGLGQRFQPRLEAVHHREVHTRPERDGGPLDLTGRCTATGPGAGTRTQAPRREQGDRTQLCQCPDVVQSAHRSSYRPTTGTTCRDPGSTMKQSLPRTPSIYSSKSKTKSQTPRLIPACQRLVTHLLRSPY